MTHYVCTGGCGGVSENSAATCQMKNCPKHGQPLTQCGCEDGEHGDVTGDGK